MNFGTFSRRVVCLVAATVVALLCAQLPAVRTADAAATVTLTGYGGDSCTAPSEAQMRAFYNNTPYSYWGVYIGGSDRGCSQPNLTRTWVTDMLAMGWDLLPIWVGPQNPCASGQATFFSSDPTTAYNQGRTEAKAAYQAWTALSGASDIPIDYDMEAPATNTAACRSAAKSFLDGWVTQLHVAPAQRAGVYSSACAGYLDDFATIPHPPDFVDAADWDGSPSTGGISCVGSNHWTAHQRHKQYQGGHNATYNGTTLNIDSRCADGPVYGNASHISTTHACAPSSASAAARRELATTSTGVTWHGATWSAGGPLDGQLHRTPTGADGATAVRVGDLPVITHDADPDTPTVGRPLVRGDGALLVPVTEHGRGARELLYATSDGRHFRRVEAVGLTAAPAPGVAAPTAVVGTRVTVLDGHRSLVHAGSTHGRTATSGLPAAAQSLRFSSTSEGTAVVETARCTTKADCRPSTELYRTSDGGRTWTR